MNKQELIDYCNAIKENKNQFIKVGDFNHKTHKNSLGLTVKLIKKRRTKISSSPFVV
mgnify:CR=1 FL=1